VSRDRQRRLSLVRRFDGLLAWDWNTAEKKMAESGRLSKVNHPSADQQAGRLDFRNL
jgi:hypothetical protein